MYKDKISYRTLTVVNREQYEYGRFAKYYLLCDLKRYQTGDKELSLKYNNQRVALASSHPLMEILDGKQTGDVFEYDGERYKVIDIYENTGFKEISPMKREQIFDTLLPEILLTNCNTFLDLLSNARENNLCMSPGCTTCGCMPYRKAIKNIGYEKMKELLDAVQESDIKDIYYRNWHDPLEVALIAMPELMTVEDTIMDKYHEIWKRYREYRKSLEEQNKQRIEEQKLEKKLRQMEISAAHKNRSERNSKIREEILQGFETKSLEEKLDVLTQDAEHNPLYYGLKFEEISADDISTIPKEKKEAYIAALDKYNDKTIRKFKRLLKTSLDNIA